MLNEGVDTVVTNLRPLSRSGRFTADIYDSEHHYVVAIVNFLEYRPTDRLFDGKPVYEKRAAGAPAQRATAQP